MWLSFSNNSFDQRDGIYDVLIFAHLGLFLRLVLVDELPFVIHGKSSHCLSLFRFVHAHVVLVQRAIFFPRVKS